MDPTKWQEKIEAIVRDVDGLVRNGFLGRGPSWMKAWYEFHLEWSKEAEGVLTIPGNCVGPFVQLAKSDGEVFELAMYLVGTRLRHRRAMPAELSSFIASFLMGEFSKPKKRRGRSPETGRDFIVLQIIQRLVDEDGLRPTTNHSPSGSRNRERSASELVCEALESTDIRNTSLENIQRIWNSKEAWENYNFIKNLRLVGLFDDSENEL